MDKKNLFFLLLGCSATCLILLASFLSSDVTQHVVVVATSFRNASVVYRAGLNADGEPKAVNSSGLRRFKTSNLESERRTDVNVRGVSVFTLPYAGKEDNVNSARTLTLRQLAFSNGSSHLPQASDVTGQSRPFPQGPDMFTKENLSNKRVISEFQLSYNKNTPAYVPVPDAKKSFELNPSQNYLNGRTSNTFENKVTKYNHSLSLERLEKVESKLTQYTKNVATANRRFSDTGNRTGAPLEHIENVENPQRGTGMAILAQNEIRKHESGRTELQTVVQKSGDFHRMAGRKKVDERSEKKGEVFKLDRNAAVMHESKGFRKELVDGKLETDHTRPAGNRPDLVVIGSGHGSDLAVNSGNNDRRPTSSVAVYPVGGKGDLVVRSVNMTGAEKIEEEGFKVQPECVKRRTGVEDILCMVRVM